MWEASKWAVILQHSGTGVHYGVGNGRHLHETKRIDTPSMNRLQCCAATLAYSVLLGMRCAACAATHVLFSHFTWFTSLGVRSTFNAAQYAKLSPIELADVAEHPHEPRLSVKAYH